MSNPIERIKHHQRQAHLEEKREMGRLVDLAREKVPILKEIIDDYVQLACESDFTNFDLLEYKGVQFAGKIFDTGRDLQLAVLMLDERYYSLLYDYQYPVNYYDVGANTVHRRLDGEGNLVLSLLSHKPGDEFVKTITRPYLKMGWHEFDAEEYITAHKKNAHIYFDARIEDVRQHMEGLRVQPETKGRL